MFIYRYLLYSHKGQFPDEQTERLILFSLCLAEKSFNTYRLVPNICTAIFEISRFLEIAMYLKSAVKLVQLVHLHAQERPGNLCGKQRND